MGKVSFPLHNVRKDILNNWHLQHLTEEVQVPEVADEYGFFTVSLTEIPESSSGSPIKIEGLTEFRSSPYDSKTKKYVLPQNSFWVNYFNGSIMFHRNQAGKTFVVQYDGKGSLVEADDVNDLNERVETNTSAISSLKETTTNFQQAIEEVESLKTNVNDLSGRVEEFGSSIDSINTELNNKVDNSALESSIDGVRSLVEGYVKEGGEVDELVNSKLLQYTPTAEFNPVKTTVDQNTADIETLKSSVENIESIKANVEDVEANVERISSNLEAIEANTSRIGEVATELETVKTAAGKNTEDVTSLTSRVTTLEGNEYVTKEDLNDLASKDFVTEKISEIEIPDVSNLATKEEIPDTSDFVKPADFAGLVSIKGTNASSAQHKIITKKNDKDITAMLWNEESGGGSQMKNEDAGKVSFIGVNNGDDGSNVWMQGYAKSISTNIGARITLNPEGFYYTKNKANGSFTEDDEVVVKKDLPDTSNLATKEEIPSVEGLASEEFVTNKISEIKIPDVSEFVTSSDVEASISAAGHVKPSELSGLVAVNGTNVSSAQHKIVTKKNEKNLTSMLWNESSGGGAQFKNENVGKISFIGVNNGDGDNEIWVQGYAKNISNNTGTRITLSTEGFFYTKNQANGSYTTDNEVLTKSDLVSVNEQLENSYETSTAVDLLLNKIAILEKKLADSRNNSNVVPQSVESATTTYNDETANMVFSGGEPVVNKTTVTAKSVDVQSMTSQNASVSFKATGGDVTITNFTNGGTVDKSTQGNTQISINTDEYVSISDCTFDANGYNSIEIGLSNTTPKSVTIDNCTFGGNLSNNAISIFAQANDAVITISNCTFESVSNVLRLSNKTNTKATFSFVNCTFKKWESNSAYTGAIICQDYTSTTADECTEANRFAPEKVKINFINCIGPDGNKIVGSSNPADYSGSGDSNQLIYVYLDKGGGVLAYSADRYPEISFK